VIRATTRYASDMGVGTSILLIAVGAILDFAVKVNNQHFNVNTIGLILLIVGAVGLLISLAFWNSWAGPGFYRRSSRRVYREDRRPPGRDPYGRGPGTYVEDRTEQY
jgi:hypothetical protein